METAASGRGAPYGKACTNCVKAKCRCVVRDGGTCERCQRLGKACTPSTTVRTRGARRPTASRTSALEDRLDDIVSLLRERNGSQTRPVGALPTPGSSSHSPARDSPDEQDLTEEELVTFREHHLPDFPLVNIPFGYTAAELQEEKPTAALAVKALVTREATKQIALGKKLRDVLAQKIVVEGERSLPLLVSLLISIAWSMSFTHGKPFLGAMIGLARPLVSDLKLDRGPSSARCPGSNPPHLVDPDENVTQTNAGRRAYIACFALSVVISTTMKYDAMRWSSQLESACSILYAHSEVEGDRILVALARLAKVALEAGDIYRQLSDDPDTPIYPSFSIAPLKSALSQTKAALTPEQLEHTTVTTFLHAASASIHELALLQPLPLSPSTPHTLKRTEHLTTLLQTCKSTTDHFLTTDLRRLTAPTMIMFGYTIKLAFCLATLNVPPWDPDLARATVDPALCFEQAIKKCEDVNQALRCETGVDSVFRVAADTMRATAPMWRVDVQRGDLGVGMEGFGTGAGGFGIGDGVGGEVLEDFWWSGNCDLWY